MSPLLISLGAGALIGLIYSLLKVQSPAPPAVALVGLLGMVIGSSLGGKLLHDTASAAVPLSEHTQVVAAPRAASSQPIANQAG